jgi:SAM-dependent methyltransferase
MDDKTFDDPSVALGWIAAVEKSRTRDSDVNLLLNAWLDRTSPIEVLEIGSGQGVCSDHIDLEGRNYTGVEPSPLLLARAKELYPHPNRRFVLGNVYDLPVSDGAFDSAFSILVWHLLSDLKKSARELSRVLKTRGHFQIVTANPDAYDEWKKLYTDFSLEGKRLEGRMQLDDQSISHDVLYLHTLTEIKDSLRAAGLETQKTEIFRIPKNPNCQGYLVSIQGQKSV